MSSSSFKLLSPGCTALLYLSLPAVLVSSVCSEDVNKHEEGAPRGGERTSVVAIELKGGLPVNLVSDTKANHTLDFGSAEAVVVELNFVELSLWGGGG